MSKSVKYMFLPYGLWAFSFHLGYIGKPLSKQKNDPNHAIFRLGIDIRDVGERAYTPNIKYSN